MAEWFKNIEHGHTVYVLKATYIEIREYDEGYAIFKGGVLISKKLYKSLPSAKRAGERTWARRKQA